MDYDLRRVTRVAVFVEQSRGDHGVVLGKFQQPIDEAAELQRAFERIAEVGGIARGSLHATLGGYPSNRVVAPIEEAAPKIVEGVDDVWRRLKARRVGWRHATGRWTRRRVANGRAAVAQLARHLDLQVGRRLPGLIGGPSDSPARTGLTLDDQRERRARLAAEERQAVGRAALRNQKTARTRETEEGDDRAPGSGGRGAGGPCLGSRGCRGCGPGVG